MMNPGMMYWTDLSLLSVLSCCRYWPEDLCPPARPPFPWHPLEVDECSDEWSCSEMGGTAACWEAQWELGHYPWQVQYMIRRNCRKVGHSPTCPKPLNIDTRRTPQKKSPECPCWVCRRGTHILLSIFLWEDVQLSTRSEPKANDISAVLYTLELCFSFNSSKKIHSTVTIGTVSFPQSIQEVECVDFQSWHGRTHRPFSSHKHYKLIFALTQHTGRHADAFTTWLTASVSLRLPCFFLLRV